MSKWKFMSVEQQVMEVMGVKTLDDVTVPQVLNALFRPTSKQKGIFAIRALAGLQARIAHILATQASTALGRNTRIAEDILNGGNISESRRLTASLEDKLIAARDGAAIKSKHRK